MDTTSPATTIAPQRNGFTLVELSIVLVIIGLLVGGVMVGQNLVSAARIRQQTAQIEKYHTSVNGFRDKYMGLPGDLPAATANGFTMTTRSGAAGHGDGNRAIEGCSAGAIVAGCENVLFWRDLSFAGLVDTSFSTATDALAQMSTTAVPSYLPNGALDQSSFTVFTDSGTNYYQLTRVSSTNASGVYTLANILTPMQAQNIDTKLDDGLALNGGIRAMEGTGPLNTAATPAATACVSNASGSPYNTSSATYAESQLCQLRLQFK